MGTNFYLYRETLEGTSTHIGKRSAAGLYCWDCRITLCRQGESAIHFDGNAWYDRCPKCLKAPENETVETSAGGRELGFNRSTPSEKSGVRSCASFTWTMPPSAFRQQAHPTEIVVRDEYGQVYTRSQFDAVLSECPVQFFDSIGTEFS